jgi:hypothetical protein
MLSEMKRKEKGKEKKILERENDFQKSQNPNIRWQVLVGADN